MADSVFLNPVLLSTIGDFTPLKKLRRASRAIFEAYAESIRRRLTPDASLQYVENEAFRAKILAFVKGNPRMLMLQYRHRQRKMSPAVRQLLAETSGLDLEVSTRSGPEWKSLENIRKLDYSSGKLADVAFMRSMRGLTHLTISGVQDLDFNGLGSLQTLVSLELDKVKSLKSGTRPLEGLSRLERLSVKGSCIASLALFGRLPKLNALDISKSQVKDLVDVRKFTGLKVLTAAHTEVHDLSPLRGLSLKELYLFRSKITTCEPLRHMHSLTKLDVRYTRFRGAEFMERLPNLTHVDCNGTLEQETSGISGKRGQRILRFGSGFDDYDDDDGFFNNNYYGPVADMIAGIECHLRQLDDQYAEEMAAEYGYESQ